MTRDEVLQQLFLAEFDCWEKSRMLPLNHEREPMLKIKDSHIAALARAESFMSQGITNAMSEKHQNYVQRDIERIKEVRLAIRILMNEPGLPFGVPIAEEPLEVETDGD